MVGKTDGHRVNYFLVVGARKGMVGIHWNRRTMDFLSLNTTMLR